MKAFYPQNLGTYLPQDGRQLFLGSRLGKVFDLLLCAVILSAPLVVYGTTIGGFSLRLSRLFLVLIVPFVFLKILEKPSLILRDKFLVFAVAPYVLFTTFSILWTPAHATAFGINRLAALYEVILIYLVLCTADLSLSRFHFFIKYYLLSALVPMAIAIWQITNSAIPFSPSEIPFSDFLIADKYEIFRGAGGLAKAGINRISSSFAEPTIFGSFICNVLLLSLLPLTKRKGTTAAFRGFQVTAFLCIILSQSKLAILTFLLGMVIILRKQKFVFLWMIMGLSLSAGILYLVLLPYLNLDLLALRFFSDSGHLALARKNIAQLAEVNLIIGSGIGSIPDLTTNKFLLSRIYEGGIVGLIFVLQVSILPFIIFRQKVAGTEHVRAKNISAGVLFSVLFSLHLYDHFIYLWPWIVIGAVMSFYNRTTEDLRMQPQPSLEPFEKGAHP